MTVDEKNIKQINAARKMAKQAAYMGVLAGVILLLVFLIVRSGVISTSSKYLSYYNDPAIIFDIVLYFLVSFWVIRRQSRMGALALLFLFLVGKLAMHAEGLSFNPGNIILSIIILAIFMRAVYGSYRLHTLRLRYDSAYHPTKKWKYGLGYTGLGLVLLLSGLGSIVLYGGTLESPIMMGKSLNARQLSILRKNNIIKKHEKPLYISSEAFWQLQEKGTVITEKYFVRYYTSNDKVTKRTFPYSDIESATAQLGNTWYDSNYIIIKLNKGEEIRLETMADHALIKAYVATIRNKISQ